MANTTKWALDPAHTEVQFKVKHFMVSKVTGSFTKFDASVETEGDDFTSAKINFTADVTSISTNNEQRDQHLRSSDFFDVENHPQIKFEGKSLEKVSDEQYKLHGTLTIRGVSKEETFDVEYGGMMQDPYGNTRVGFEINGKINRKEYGVSFNMVSETGGILLGEDVAIHIAAEFTKVTQQETVEQSA